MERRKRSRTITNEDVTDYIVKKLEKHGKKLKSAATIFGYSNDSNPFRDSNLDQKFVWRKKILRDVVRGVSPDAFSLKAEKKRQRERAEEIERGEKQRKLRDLEKARREEEMALFDRERGRVGFDLGKKVEEKFVYNQSKIKSQIRLREGRAKPIDILINHINPLDDLNMKIDRSRPPYEVLEGLTIKELEEIVDEIKLYLQFDKATPVHTQYWEAILVVCDWEFSKVWLREAQNRADSPLLLFAEERGIHSSIESDVKNFLIGKSSVELEAEQFRIESKMMSGEAKLVEFWESLLHRIRIFKAKALLEEIVKNHHTQQEESSEEQLELLRCEEDDNIESTTATTTTTDKFSLMKPKFMNHVNTGYLWNKYNRIHYDHDNPPPKQVLGYKFSVFYPDLLDSSSPPSYSVEEDQESSSSTTCIITFHGGPPYEDIAFRIVKGDWEYSKKKGFKSTFERGVLQLSFNLKRYTYRR